MVDRREETIVLTKSKREKKSVLRGRWRRGMFSRDHNSNEPNCNLSNVEVA